MQRAASHQELNTGSELPPPNLVLVRYGELSLKGGNRRLFERALMRNIKTALEHVSRVRVERHYGRLAVIPERRVNRVAQRLQDVFGIKSISPAWSVSAELEPIRALTRRVFEKALEAAGGTDVSFRLRTRRADKRFPMTSTELDTQLGGELFEAHPGLRVDLTHPDIEVGIEIREEGAYVFAQKLPGPGGLPVSTLGRVLCLLSGGIDSPVAAWLAMKRGCSVGHVTFHSKPFLGDSSRRQVIDLARVLGRYQPRNVLFVAPFTEAQTMVRDIAPEGYRTILYRRMMQRIAARIAYEYGFGALVTGESLGQVASQTLENMRCIATASDMTVLRPVVTHDKEEIMDLARRIGTLEISNRNEPDCCTLFMPRKPVIHGKVEHCLAAEARMEIDDVVARAVEGVEQIKIVSDD